MGFFNWLKRGKKEDEAAHSQAAEIPQSYIMPFMSEEGKKRGADRRPLLIYGHLAHVGAQRTASDTTVNCIAIADLDRLRQVMAKLPSVGLCAMSCPEHVGEAEEAIALYRAAAPEHLPTYYGAWDYNVERAAQRAIGCGADGITMPGILTQELYAYLFGVMGEVQDGAAIPTTLEEHVARLERYTTKKSKFWEMQDLIKSEFY